MRTMCFWWTAMKAGEDTGLLMDAVTTLIKHLDADCEPVTEKVK